MVTVTNTDWSPTIGPFRIDHVPAYVTTRSLPKPLASGEPLAIVWHTIGAGATRFTAEQLVDRLHRGNMGPDKSWHYTIAEDGRIWNHVDPSCIANHCLTDRAPYLNRRGPWHTKTPNHNSKKHPDYSWWFDQLAAEEDASPITEFPELYAYGSGSINKCTLGVEFVATASEALTEAQLLSAQFLAEVCHPGLRHVSHAQLQPHRRNGWDLTPQQWDQLSLKLDEYA